MTDEDFMTLFAEEEMEHFQRVGISVEVLDGFWEGLKRRAKPHDLENLSPETLREKILAWEQGFLRLLLEEFSYPSTPN